MRRRPRSGSGGSPPSTSRAASRSPVAAIGGYVVPRNGDTLSLAAANLFTCLGGLCFLVGAVLGLAADAAGQDGAAPAHVVAER